jgi:nanoRNase/pAp phosphatase (c-di-AMP/oligoRNAs hydrolase)
VELRDRSLRIRKSVSKRYTGGGRQSDTGAQFRGQILIELEDAIKDVSTMANMLKQ